MSTAGERRYQASGALMPRVERVAEDARRSTFTLQAICTCGWRGPRLVAPDTGSVRLNAPATNAVARNLRHHQLTAHPG